MKVAQAINDMQTKLQIKADISFMLYSFRYDCIIYNSINLIAAKNKNKNEIKNNKPLSLSHTEWLILIEQNKATTA